jgi:hypothetical protein
MVASRRFRGKRRTIAIAAAGNLTALISLGIPKLVRFHKSRPATGPMWYYCTLLGRHRRAGFRHAPNIGIIRLLTQMDLMRSADRNFCSTPTSGNINGFQIFMPWANSGTSCGAQPIHRLRVSPQAYVVTTTGFLSQRSLAACTSGGHHCPTKATPRPPKNAAFIDVIYSATVLGFFWSATMNTKIFARLSMLGFRDVE